MKCDICLTPFKCRRKCNWAVSCGFDGTLSLFIEVGMGVHRTARPRKSCSCHGRLSKQILRDLGKVRPTAYEGSVAQ